MRVEDGAVVLQEMVEAAARVDRPRVIEGQRVAHVVEQRLAAVEIGSVGDHAGLAGVLVFTV